MKSWPARRNHGVIGPAGQIIGNTHPQFFPALIGPAVDRQEGGNGIKGAIISTLVERQVRAIVPKLAFAN